MTRVSHDAWTRRASFLALGAAALTTLGRPFAANGKKNRKKRRIKGDVNKLCKKQVGQCIDLASPDCGDDPECVEGVDRCCSLLGTCDLAGAFACFEALDAARGQIIRPRSTR